VYEDIAPGSGIFCKLVFSKVSDGSFWGVLGACKEFQAEVFKVYSKVSAISLGILTFEAEATLTVDFKFDALYFNESCTQLALYLPSIRRFARPRHPSKQRFLEFLSRFLTIAFNSDSFHMTLRSATRGSVLSILPELISNMKGRCS
jgi:hypothetical protein